MKLEITHRAWPARLEGLWLAYRSGGDLRIRDRLVLTLAPLIPLAGFAAHDDSDLSRAFGVLVTAVDRFDPSRDGALEQFAWRELSRLAAAALVAA